MYIFIATLTRADHLTIDQMKEQCRKARAEGKRAEILTAEEAKRRNLLGPMQDLTKINDHFDVVREGLMRS